MTRVEFCRSLVWAGAQVVRDGADHSQRANRCLVDGGACVGYYTVLTGYDEGTDSFRSGGAGQIPAGQVDAVAEWDAWEQALAALKGMRRET